MIINNNYYSFFIFVWRTSINLYSDKHLDKIRRKIGNSERKQLCYELWMNFLLHVCCEALSSHNSIIDFFLLHPRKLSSRNKGMLPEACLKVNLKELQSRFPGLCLSSPGDVGSHQGNARKNADA